MPSSKVVTFEVIDIILEFVTFMTKIYLQIFENNFITIFYAKQNNIGNDHLNDA
jgi:hypothetical protein